MWLLQAEKFNFQRLLKTFRRIGLGILLLFVVLMLIVVFGEMNDEVTGKGTVTGIREYTIKSLVDAASVKIFHPEGTELAAGEPIIILMHEGVPETVDLMPWLLDRLLGGGYAFGNLDNFPSSWTFTERGYLEETG